MLIFEFHINGIIKYVCIIVCLWLLRLNVMSMRFTPVFPFNISLFFFFLSLYSISWIIQEFTCHSMVDGFLDCVQFRDIVNKTCCEHLAHVFWWTYFC